MAHRGGTWSRREAGEWNWLTRAFLEKVDIFPSSGQLSNSACLYTSASGLHDFVNKSLKSRSDMGTVLNARTRARTRTEVIDKIEAVPDSSPLPERFLYPGW